MADLPDYTKYVASPPSPPIVLPPAVSSLQITPVMQRLCLIQGTNTKAHHALSTSWLKQHCIQMPYVTTASPSGQMVSYEGAYTCLALIEKAGSGEVALAKNCLDEWVKLQNDDGSWSQRFYPYLNAVDLHDAYEDLQVDSGAACLAWAMAKYDIHESSEVYKTPVRKAFSFLRAAQLAFNAQGYPLLICNQRINGEWNYVAFLGDCGEVLLATKYVLDAYGADLTTSEGYSIKDFGNALYYAIAAYGYLGLDHRYFATVYPYDAMPWGLEGYGLKDKYVFAQAICSQAVYEWANSAYRTGSDYSTMCVIVLDFINTIGVGRWGGFMYSPYYEAPDEDRKEYTVYTAFMAMAMNSVDATRYADRIQACKDFIRWLAMPDGRVYDTVDQNGILWAGSEFDPGVTRTLGEGAPTRETWQFIGHTISCGLLAGA